MFRTLDKLDELYCDRNGYEALLRKEREAHDLEVYTLKDEMAAKKSNLSEKGYQDSSVGEELKASKAVEDDARHKSESMAQDRYREHPRKE